MAIVARVNRRLGPLVLMAALTFVTTSCSDDEPTTQPTPQPSTTASDPSGVPSSQAPAEPTESASASATGPALELDHVSLNSPEGWTITKESDPFSAQASDGAGSTLFLGELPDLAPGEAVDLRQLAQDSITNGFYVRDPEIVDPTEAGGVAVYHVSGQIDAASYLQEFGTITAGVLVTIKLQTPVGLAADQRQELVDQVLASATFD